MDKYTKVLENPYLKKRFNASEKYIIEEIWGTLPTFPKTVYCICFHFGCDFRDGIALATEKGATAAGR